MRKDSTRKPSWEGILSVRSSNKLAKAGVNTMAKLNRLSSAEFETILGPTAATEVRNWLIERQIKNGDARFKRKIDNLLKTTKARGQ